MLFYDLPQMISLLMLDIFKYIGRYEIMIFNEDPVYQEKFRTRIDVRKRFKEILELSREDFFKLIYET